MFTLLEFKKSYDSFEPYIDTRTMEIHHLKHHGGYVSKLNQALKDTGMNAARIEDIFEKISELPSAIRNNAGGHYNHSVFWSLLTRNVTVASPDLEHLIIESFGSLADMKMAFSKAALSVFGSGWTWLVLNTEGKLEIVTTKNQDNPLMKDIYVGYPLIALDVWEHAYYLNYQNKRLEYIEAFWNILDWDEVSRRFSQQPEMNEI